MGGRSVGLLVLTVVFAWDYTVAFLSGIWQFVTVDIPRLIIAAISAFFMLLIGILWFLTSLGGAPGRFPFSRSPFQRSYLSQKPRSRFPSSSRTGMRLPDFKPFRMSSHKSVETSVRLTEIQPPEMTYLTSVNTSTPLPETEQPEKADILGRLLARLRLIKIEWPDIDRGSWSMFNSYRSTHVRGYFRKDGTYVSGHFRSGYTKRSRRW